MLAQSDIYRFDIMHLIPHPNYFISPDSNFPD